MKVVMGSNRYGNKSNVCDIVSSPGPEDDQLSLCCLCGQTFPSIKSLHTHINVVHEEVADSFDFNPTNGENDDPAPIDLRCHISRPSHNEELTSRSNSPIPCPNCRKSFSDVTSLRAHIDAVHQGSNSPIPCPNCRKSFSDVTSLRAHIDAVHQGSNSPIPCPNCRKSFSDVTSLRAHIDAVHQGSNSPIPCPNCRKSFSDVTSLRAHIDAVHQGSNSPIPCPNCRKSFSDVTSLRAHIDAVHQDNRTARCDICGKTFTTVSYLRLHITTVHEGVRAYICSLCQKSYTQKHSLKKHLMNAHSIVMNKDGMIEYARSNNNNNGAIYKSTQSGYPDETRAPKSRKKLLLDSPLTPESSSPSPSGINNVESPASSETKAHCNSYTH